MSSTPQATDLLIIKVCLQRLQREIQAAREEDEDARPDSSEMAKAVRSAQAALSRLLDDEGAIVEARGPSETLALPDTPAKVSPGGLPPAPYPTTSNPATCASCPHAKMCLGFLRPLGSRGTTCRAEVCLRRLHEAHDGEFGCLPRVARRIDLTENQVVSAFVRFVRFGVCDVSELRGSIATEVRRRLRRLATKPPV